MPQVSLDFKPGDKVKVVGHAGIAKVVSIEPIGEGNQFKVELFFPESKEMESKMFPFTEIKKVPEVMERVKMLDFDPSWKYNLFMDAMRFSLACRYDPLFSLSVTKIDAVPHQIEGEREYTEF
jgi:hypothetical protein